MTIERQFARIRAKVRGLRHDYAVLSWNPYRAFDMSAGRLIR